MSKTNPNQDFYKIGGRSQSDGPDRELSDVHAERQQTSQTDEHAKNAKHPAVLRSKKK